MTYLEKDVGWSKCPGDLFMDILSNGHPILSN